jgi:hypothetical protein
LRKIILKNYLKGVRYNSNRDKTTQNENMNNSKRAEHKCQRCHQVFDRKTNLARHLNRKKPCAEVLKRPVEEEGCSVTLTIKGYSLQTLIDLLGEDRIVSFTNHQLTQVEPQPPVSQVEISETQSETSDTQGETSETQSETSETQSETSESESESEKEEKLEKAKEKIIEGLKVEHQSEVKAVRQKFKHPEIIKRKTEELDTNLKKNIEKIRKRKTLPKPVKKKVEEKKEVNVEEYVDIAKETHINVQDTRAKLYRLLDRDEKETKESRELKTRLDKLTRRLFEVKMALKRAGYNLKQIEFRPEPVNRL